MGTSTSAILQVTTASAGTAPGTIPAPTITSTTTTSVSLSWTVPTTGTTPFQYQVFQSLATGTPSYTSATALLSVTTATISGLSPNTGYLFYVVVYNSAGQSQSPTVTVTTLAVLPTAPTNLSLSGSAGQTTVSLTWTAPSSGTAPLTYTVSSRTPTGSGSYTTAVTSTTTTATVTGLTAGTSYDFIVTASNAAGTGPASSPLLNVVTSTGAVAPSAPTNLAASSITQSSMTVSWTPPATGTAPLTYVLQYRTP